MACIMIMHVWVKFQFTPVIFNPTYHFTIKLHLLQQVIPKMHSQRVLQRSAVI